MPVTSGPFHEKFIGIPNCQPLEDREIKPMIVKVIDLAESEILISAFTYDDLVVTDALIRAHRRGVTIFMSVDHQQTLEFSSSLNQKETLARLLEWHTRETPFIIQTLKPRDTSRYAVEHSKFIVIDQSVAVFGSANFTGNSLDKCSEFCELTRLRPTVQALLSKSNRQRRDGVLLTSELLDAAKRKKEEQSATAKESRRTVS